MSQNIQKKNQLINTIPLKVIRKNGTSNCAEISDQDLVRLCIENQREAWNEFFRRYIPDIKSAIKGRLRRYGYDNMTHNQDIIWDIHEKIVIKLIKKNNLNQCDNPIGIRFWLRKAVPEDQINQISNLLNRARKSMMANVPF